MDSMPIQDLMRQENKIAANWLIHYRERSKDFFERRREIECGTKRPDENVGGGRPNLPGKPTESLAVALATHDESDTGRWVKTVDDVMRIVGPRKRQLIDFRQECRFYISPGGGRPSWIPAVQIRFGEKTGWTPSESIVKNMWNDVVSLTVRVAILNKCKF